ncbi:hypothetical protein [Flavobacterium caeni]|uniref:Replication initiation factor n=1 Tax=Flavobacterium caeni TaxID=490189 RepID=A0A1G5EKU4_9FLAO|nr:hypothetical protein [Flavobacterium caeni]SCY27576.1 hypothetical protein SAMN02927903_01092 [Flavobacterium caeni]
MIDLVRSQVRDVQLIDYLRQHPKLEWVSNEDKFNRFDFEVVKTKHVRQFKGILFRFFDDRLDIIFKPHFYFNDDRHNANDFSMNSSITTILEFQRTFQVDLQQFPVFGFEYGVNVISPLDVKDLITYAYAHDRNEFRNDADLGFSKRSFSTDKRGKANTYKTVKFYAKGIQQVSHCHPDTVRFEIKSQSRKFIRQLDIVTMYDLTKPEVYAKLAESIIEEFDAMLILDGSADTSRLSASDRFKLTNYQNTMTWYRILQQHRNAFSRNKKTYHDLLDKTGTHLKRQLSIAVQSKLYELTEASVGEQVQIPI